MADRQSRKCPLSTGRVPPRPSNERAEVRRLVRAEIARTLYQARWEAHNQ
jgi:hypothetical protein